MALLHDSVEFKKLDVRMIERNLARGLLSRDELDKAQSKLPDDEANCEWVNIESLEQEGQESDSNGSH